MWTVYKKELLELIRDKKTLIFVVLLPTVLIPVLFGGMFYFTAKAHINDEEKVLRFAAIGPASFEEITVALSEDSKFTLVTNIAKDAINESIEQGKVDFVLLYPTFDESLNSSGSTHNIELFFNASSSTTKIFERVNTFISLISSRVRAEKLTSLGVSVEAHDSYTNPIVLVEKNIAGKRENIGERIGGFVPYLLILLCFGGAAYPCIEIGVGEKERNTLETLLLTPIPRINIVIAKTLVLASTSLLSVFLSILSLFLWIILVGQSFAIEKLGSLFSAFSYVDLAMVFVMLIPLSVIFSSVLLSASIYSRSIKETQNYIQPLTMVILAATVIAMLPGFELTWKMTLVPISNVALAMKELMKGTVDYSMLSFILLSSIAYAGVLSVLSARWFNRESVLFRN